MNSMTRCLAYSSVQKLGNREYLSAFFWDEVGLSYYKKHSYWHTKHPAKACISYLWVGTNTRSTSFLRNAATKKTSTKYTIACEA